MKNLIIILIGVLATITVMLTLQISRFKLYPTGETSVYKLDRLTGDVYQIDNANIYKVD